MTDVRDRSPDIEEGGGERRPIEEARATLVAERGLAEPAVEARQALVPQTLVGRVLAPLRGRTGRELVVPVARSRDVAVPRLSTRTRTRFAVLASMVLVVLLPVIAAGVYLFVISSDQYVAEMRFAVRKADAPRSADGVIGSGAAVTSSSLLSGGAGVGGEDAEIIANYIHSRAAIEDVSRTVDVEAIYRRPEADFYARLRTPAKIEKLVKYWNGMVGVYVEPTSGIVSVSVVAFRREDALTLAKAILASSERLANSLTLKMRADQTRLSEDEVRRAEGGVRFALADLTSFRNSQRLIDPEESSKNSGKLLMGLIGDRIQTEGQLFVIQRAQGPNAPGIGGIKARLQSINQHVTELQDQLAGDKAAAGNMAATLSQFEELEVKKQFAEKMFEFARQGLERAQLNALSQSIYLAVFLPPTLPQEYTYPSRVTVFLLISFTALMAWVSGATITASVFDHRL